MLPEEYRPTKTLYFDGTVFDQLTRLPLPGHFQLTDIESGELIIISDADKVDGSFMVALPVNREYAIEVTQNGYAPYSLNFNLKIPDGSDHYHLDIPMNPLTSSTENILANVFFDLGKATLRKESAIELKNLGAFLKRNRLSFKGYGETQVIMSDKTIESLKSLEEKEIAHQKNRRTVYKIIN